MCRVRFSLTGIYFDSLEPSRPREEVFQPLMSALPPVVRNRQRDAVSKVIESGAIRADAVSIKIISENADAGGQTQTTADQSDSSSSTPRDEEGQGQPGPKNAKTIRASIGSKRARDSSLSLSLSSFSSSSSSVTCEEDEIHESANNKISRIASKNSKHVNSPTHKSPEKPSQVENPKYLGRSRKAPPAKRVRFAMDVQETILPSDNASDTSSSHSSDDSYTDPPSPTEPYDAFAGYCRNPGASRSRRMNGRIAGSKMRFLPLEEDANADGTNGFLDSEDGSEVDVQGLPVRGRPQRTVRAGATGQKSDQQHHQNSSTSLARSKPLGRVTDESRVMGGGLEGNVDGGLHLEKSHLSQERPVSPLRSVGQLRYPKLRSGKNLPEPIFVVRPRWLLDAKEKGMPADMLKSRRHSRGFSKNESEGMKVKNPKKTKNPIYRAPSVSDDLKRDVEFDEDLGLLIRDV